MRLRVIVTEGGCEGEGGRRDGGEKSPEGEGEKESEAYHRTMYLETYLVNTQTFQPVLETLGDFQPVLETLGDFQPVLQTDNGILFIQAHKSSFITRVRS